MGNFQKNGCYNLITAKCWTGLVLACITIKLSQGYFSVPQKIIDASDSQRQSVCVLHPTRERRQFI